jgi:hypothetical protein
MFTRGNRRRRSARLRAAAQSLPLHTREAMIRGIDSNQIIVGAYTDRDGGICPMLAAHRNGGRTNFASFARAWDDFTAAGKRSRRATLREVRVLRSYLEISLLGDEAHEESLADAGARIRAERRSERRADRFRVYDLRMLGRRRAKRPVNSPDAPERQPAQTL